MPWNIVRREIARLVRQKSDMAATITELEARCRQQALRAEQLYSLKEYCGRVAANLSTFDFAEKRLALEALGVMVHADGRTPLIVGHWSLNAHRPC
jgi:hypothetical protein